MKTIFHKAKDRGYFDHGWLKTYHSFSFAEYRDPDKIHFGRLRVLNDDIIAPGQGFGTHPHENMEIVTIPLAGSLAHKDSTGHEQVNHSFGPPGEMGRFGHHRFRRCVGDIGGHTLRQKSSQGHLAKANSTFTQELATSHSHVIWLKLPCVHRFLFLVRVAPT